MNVRFLGFSLHKAVLGRSAITLFNTIEKRATSQEVLNFVANCNTSSFGDNVADNRKRTQVWFASMNLHVWLVLVRLRSEGKDGVYLGQEIYNAYWAHLEQKMAQQMNNPFLLGKYMKAAFGSYYGTMLALDRGQWVKEHSDPFLAAALWRNVFVRNWGENVSHICEPTTLEQGVIYVRQMLQILDWHRGDAIMKGALYLPDMASGRDLFSVV